MFLELHAGVLDWTNIYSVHSWKQFCRLKIFTTYIDSRLERVSNKMVFRPRVRLPWNGIRKIVRNRIENIWIVTQPICTLQRTLHVFWFSGCITAILCAHNDRIKKWLAQISEECVYGWCGTYATEKMPVGPSSSALRDTNFTRVSHMRLICWQRDYWRFRWKLSRPYDRSFGLHHFELAFRKYFIFWTFLQFGKIVKFQTLPHSETISCFQRMQ